MSRKKKGRIREEDLFKEVEVEKLTCQVRDHRAPQEDRDHSPPSILKQKERTRQEKENQSTCCSRGKSKTEPQEGKEWADGAS